MLAVYRSRRIRWRGCGHRLGDGRHRAVLLLLLRATLLRLLWRLRQLQLGSGGPSPLHLPGFVCSHTVRCQVARFDVLQVGECPDTGFLKNVEQASYVKPLVYHLLPDKSVHLLADDELA